MLFDRSSFKQSLIQRVVDDAGAHQLAHIAIIGVAKTIIHTLVP